LCGDAAGATAYRATAEKVRQGLCRLMEPDGYFIRSEESDGRHGVIRAAKHGYFEAHPNHDAGRAFASSMTPRTHASWISC